ncbi:MAG: nucleotide-binding protein [Acidobacteria bacterium]|nr:nucleotide-binding protein [Acidobacteriota bacterium]MBV9068495.1 nucleotide-binding protein [Acidobacteriota bacterium]MBV9186643.1 nucleotide-binding protein [Acidobacteriota bacterium]
MTRLDPAELNMTTTCDVVAIGALNIDYIIDRSSSVDHGVIQELRDASERDTESLRDEASLSNLIGRVGIEHCRVIMGGSAFNAIRAMASLRTDLRIGYVGVAGQSEDMQIVRELARRNIDARCVWSVAESAGRCVSISAGTDRQLFTFPGANRRFAEMVTEHYDETLQYMTAAKWVHVTSLLDEQSPAVVGRLLRDLRARSPLTTISIDPGYIWVDTETPGFQAVLASSDVLFLNDRELRKLGAPGSDDLHCARYLSDRLGSGRLLVVLKRYDEVKIVQTQAGWNELFTRTYPTAAKPPSVLKDDTGAGDVFAGGFIAGRLLPMLALDVSNAVELGLRLVSEKLQNIGDNGFDRFRDILVSLLRERTKPTQHHASPSSSPKVFIVHGHDSAILAQVENVLHRIGAIPVYYDRAPRSGSKTIVEFLEDIVRTADAIVVLMTPDDEGRERRRAMPLQPRARENVLIEAGYGVLAMREHSILVAIGGVNIPSDLAGIDRIQGDEWSTDLAAKLAQRLSNMGLRVHPANAI